MRMWKITGVALVFLAAVGGVAAIIARRCERAVELAKASRKATAAAVGLTEAEVEDPWYGIRLGGESAKAAALLTRLGFDVEDGFQEKGTDTLMLSARRRYGEMDFGRPAYDEWVTLTYKPGGSIVEMSCLQAELGGKWRRLSVPSSTGGGPGR